MRKEGDEYWYTSLPKQHEALDELDLYCSEWGGLARSEATRRILIEWGDPDTFTTVEWIFTPREDGTTFVTITNSGFQGDEQAIVQQALGSTGGFTLVLAGLKALLEHGIQLNLVADRFPDAHKTP